MNIPCKDCITLAICRQVALDSNQDAIVRLDYLIDRCSIFNEFWFKISNDPTTFSKHMYDKIIRFLKDYQEDEKFVYARRGEIITSTQDELKKQR